MANSEDLALRSRAIYYTIVDCSLGRVLVAGTKRGLCFIRFGMRDAELEATLRHEFPFAQLVPNDVPIKHCSDAVVSYVDGHSTHLEVPTDVGGSRFQHRVWEALRAIPRGTTRSYSDVARSLGMPAGARAVARACATNPLPVVIPCHRVVAKDGIGGYGGGVARKRALLEGEARRGAWGRP